MKQLHEEVLVLFYLCNLNPPHFQGIIYIIQCGRRQLLHEKGFTIVIRRVFVNKFIHHEFTHIELTKCRSKLKNCLFGTTRRIYFCSLLNDALVQFQISSMSSNMKYDVDTIVLCLCTLVTNQINQKRNRSIEVATETSSLFRRDNQKS